MLKLATAMILSILATPAVPRMQSKANGATAGYPMPEDGRISRGTYQNEYFGFLYPLPANWVEDIKGPPPSATGYYCLVTLKPRDSLAATLLIAAQDNFFAKRQVTSATDFLEQAKRQLDPALPAQPPTELKIGGHSFARLDYAGAGLRHVLLATEIRCHTVIFSITSGSSQQIESVVASLNKIAFSGADSSWPLCVPEYATADHIIRHLEPAPAGPRFSSVPARVMIGANGSVEHVHAIGGLPEQAKSIQDALSRWEFKPYLLNGKPVAVETGLIVQFSAGQ
jgi:Gram-negative bacterial TonB protein C-terminal